VANPKSGVDFGREAGSVIRLWATHDVEERVFASGVRPHRHLNQKHLKKL
jgi:hypothetical protein